MGKPFPSGVPVHSWWRRFLNRHPEDSLRTPSIIDGGRHWMSKRSLLNAFYCDTKAFLMSLDVLDKADRLYNIDESWYNGKNEAHQRKVVVSKGLKVPHVVNNVTIEHITFTMCISASGKQLPPLFTFTKSLPSDN